MDRQTTMQIRGTRTKNHLLECSRELFYENGYRNTTARMISSRANTNLGLLNYYFNGKIEIGATIYYDIRNTFDRLILEQEPAMNPVELFLFSSAIELYLCLKYPNFGKFFVEITDEPQIHDRVVEYIISTIEQYNAINRNREYAQLAGLSISAVKPAIVRYALNNPTVISGNTYLLYYLVQQLHFFGMDAGHSTAIMELFKKYRVALDEKLTPILEPLETGT